MLIDDENKYIFIHIPKNAGSSMTLALQPLGGRKLVEFDTHVPCTTLRPYIGNKFDSYFKFAFVRNPWDRLYSMYKFTLMRGWMSNKTSFEKFLESDHRHVTEACKYQNPIVPITKKPQIDFIKNENGDIDVDFIGKYESINSDFMQVCKHIKIEYDKLPRANAAQGKDYRDAYTDTTKQFVEEYFAKDIKLFNYSF